MQKNSDLFKYFTNDVRPNRDKHWLSIYYQLTIPVCDESVNSVLEFGPGRGLMGAILKHYGIKYKSVDVVDGIYGYSPDHVSDIEGLQIEEKFDLVCAFQTLEHNPIETLSPHLMKMASFSNKYVYISLPYYGRWLGLNISLNLPKLEKNFHKVFTLNRFIKKKRPIEKYKKSKTPYSHHWFEVGDKGVSKKDIKNIAKACGLSVNKMFHSQTFPYHLFILMEKRK
jgi:SAM-dependent methyltransferase